MSDWKLHTPNGVNDVLPEECAKKKDIEFGKDDRILTLSTCTNGAYYARYALHAKLIEKIVD